ncbi:hypothetical protein HGH93_22180 [Chitinophaga polysaccharea]|uniref:hypothetical protein n=1 Tax=Chitinophaga TaxID=79328 RepID=UPI0014559DC6|nr:MULTISPECIES: hypothetical protein [Chitinophaga]NLR60828.1 hypothetical protein [Chitinophaga polysaccharea]NLU94798.1 hypothetical protein [Chitinophaga sp. Ak27]
MKQLMLTLLFIGWIGWLSAQPALMPIGKNTRMGAYSRHFQQIITAWSDPAALSCIQRLTAGIYSENRFLVKEASLYAAMIAIPVYAGAFGGSITRLGNTAYHQQQLSGGYGRRLGRRVGLGLQFNYETTTVQGLGTVGQLTISGGLLWHISEQWHTGLQVQQLVNGDWLYIGGAGFEASGDFLLSAEVLHAGKDTGMKAAAHYRIARALALEMGIASRPAYHTAACILYLRSLRIDIGAGFHPRLGITPSTALIWLPSAE